MNQSTYTMSDLIRIVKTLRSPEGCPWDRVQTHESIRYNLIEESYEVVDAIDTTSEAALREELGDVLLQVVFHSVLAEEEDQFSFSEVVNVLCSKLISRHPHVFADAEASRPEEALERWDEAKQKEKQQKTVSATLEAVPKCFPALMRAQKVGKRANKGISEKEKAVEYLENFELEYVLLKQEIESPTDGNVTALLGNLLFSTCNIARLLQVEAEDALQKTTDAFIADMETEESKLLSVRSVKAD